MATRYLIRVYNTGKRGIHLVQVPHGDHTRDAVFKNYSDAIETMRIIAHMRTDMSFIKCELVTEET